MENDAQPCAQPDGPVHAFNLANVGAARRLACFVGPHDFGFGVVCLERVCGAYGYGEDR